ncbi:PXMP2/4 family protein 4-like [Hordeum vulgare]|nr:PXMP2/4 family protein 4-like [Hordeum vulgare]
MVTAGALHAGSRVLLPIRRTFSTPWSHVRSHLHSTKPSSAPLPPPPRPPPSSHAASTRFTAAPTRRSGSIGSGVVTWYLGSIEARPLLTKSITAAAIYTVADLTSQVTFCSIALSPNLHFLEETLRDIASYIFSSVLSLPLQMITLPPEESLDLIRTLRMASYGMLFSGPSLHYWFNFISKVVPKRDVVSTFKKMFLGQAVYGPIINCIFFSYNAGLQGETIPEIIARLKRDIIPTIKNGLIYWPLCDFITFKFIPVHLQPLVSNSFAFLWTIYLTYMAGLKKPGMEVIMSS